MLTELATMSGALELLGGARTSLIVTVGMTGEVSEETEADSLETLDLTLAMESVERTEADSSMSFWHSGGQLSGEVLQDREITCAWLCGFTSLLETFGFSWTDSSSVSSTEVTLTDSLTGFR